MKKFFIVALAAMGMTACMQDAVVETPHGGAIAFENAFVGNATRAAQVVTTTNLEEFQVWGYVNAPSGVLFDNTTVSKQGNVWSYGELQYWAPGQQYYFAAVAPSVATNWSLAMESAVGDPRVLTFANDGNTDLIYAWENRTSKPTGQANDVVAFKFDHLLSKVMLSFKNAFPTDNVSVVLSDIALATPKNAKINLAASTWAWDITPDDEYVTGLDFGVYTLGKGESGSSPEYFIIPAECEISFDIDVFVEDQKVYTGTKTATLPADAFEMGHAYNLSAEINPGILDFDEIVFTVDKVEEWNEPATDHYVDAYKDETGANYYVATAEGLAQVGEEINAGTFNGTVNLTGDIDLNDLVMMRSAVESNWTPVGTEDKPFTGTFDGNGYTIKNLTLVEKEAKEGKAFIGFFGYAKNVTIKNVTFENVYVNIPCLDIDHSQGHIGAVVGSLEGTSTVENVTVRGDIFVEASLENNGASRVAVVAGGNSNGNVTMKNVHVIANEGSYLKANNNVGALAGQLQVKSVFENCSSNIDVTGYKFFAGGIIGLAAGDQKFTDCHTTGDVKILAGREGRHNDEYRVGGIAGGWADNTSTPCVLIGCSYTGEVSGENADGAVAEPLDYAGYVGRGYTLSGRAGSKVIIDGVEYVQKYNDQYGIYDVYRNEIKTAEEFRAFAASVNDGNSYEGQTVVLAADIDLNNEEWTPIGSATQDHGFMGDFYGNGHTIKNLKITELTPDADGYVYAGLFGVTEGTADKNNYIGGFSIENVHIDCEGSSIVAAAIAYPYYTIVDDITVKGDIIIKGKDYTAGVLAYTRRCVNAKNIAIEGNEGSVVEGKMTVGGVISDIQMNGGLTADYSNFSASGLTIKGAMHVGGISGIIARQTLDGATVENVVIECEDNRKGIVSGSLGENSTLLNVSYSNVTGADYVIGATYKDASPVIEVDGVYMGVSTVSGTEQLQAAIDAEQAVIYLAPNTVFNGTVYMKSNVTIVGLEGSTMHNINLNGANNVTLKNITFDAAGATMAYGGDNKVRFMANIVSRDQSNSSTVAGAQNLVISGCTFTGNFANGGMAICFSDQTKTGSGNITIEDCTFDTLGSYADIYGYYFGNKNNLVIKGNTFKSANSRPPVYLGRYASSVPVVVKNNHFATVTSIENAVTLQAHGESYTVSMDASDNTFAE